MFFLYAFLIALSVVNVITAFADSGEDFLPLVPRDLDELNLFGQVCCYILIWLFLPVAMIERVVRFLFTM